MKLLTHSLDRAKLDVSGDVFSFLYQLVLLNVL